MRFEAGPTYQQYLAHFAGIHSAAPAQVAPEKIRLMMVFYVHGAFDPERADLMLMRQLSTFVRPEALAEGQALDWSFHPLPSDPNQTGVHGISCWIESRSSQLRL